MARVHVVQHTAGEGLGRLTEWLPAAGVDVHPTHPYLGNRVPPSVEGDALIVLGGPMNANDDEGYPWLPSVRTLMRSAVEDGVPTIGICLGAQLLAVAMGGEVTRGEPGPEIGLFEVNVEVGDELLTAGPMPTIQWHYDAVTRLPEHSTVLASSAMYPVQAFRVGELAWGLQFHVEATADIVRTWAAEEGMGPEIAEPIAFADAEIAAVGQRIARRFAAIITG
jgi:GMP synthase-like glutamine amidotransferase